MSDGRSADHPPVRSSFGLAYDAARHRLVLFGGSDSTFQRLGDRWEWSAAGWRRVAIAGPAPRAGFAMVYDAARRVTVLFGGRTAAGLAADTWTYDGTRWTRVDSGGPPARQLAAMAFDASRGRVVLFGGSAGNATLGDTWEWDGAHWSATAADPAGPVARGSHALAYDAERRRVVLVGGYAGDAALSDVWEWDGARWSRVADGPAVFHEAAGYDARSRSMVVFGGFDGDARSARTWIRDAAGWRSTNVDVPPARAEHRGIYMDGTGVVVFGGIGGQGMTLEERGRAKLNDLWAYSAGRWRPLDVPVRAAAVARPAPATSALPSGVTAAMVATGDSLYHTRSCGRCHGMDATGGRNAPSLVAGRWLQIDGSYAASVRLVTDGVPLEAIKDTTHTLDMHPRGGSNLSDAEIAAVAGYVWTISRGKP